MLEKIGAAGFETISVPDKEMIACIERIMQDGVQQPVVAEIGVGIGATTLPVAKALNGKGQLHLFDFEGKLKELSTDLLKLGFTNIVCHGNSRRHWDSYVWPLLKLARDGTLQFDLVYLDGSHAYIHDVPAFFLAERLLKPGGMIVFDDYYWSHAKSPTQNPEKNPQIREFLTDEQIGLSHTKMLVDILVKPNPRFEELKPNAVYRKKSE
jgi:predicted O-methyltransferase YrrM